MHFNVRAARLEDISEKIRQKIERKIEKLSSNIKNKIGKSKPGFKTKLLFGIMRKMQQSNTWNVADRDYWQKNNWLEASRPWR